MNKKQFFKKKLKEIDYATWDLEFKINKSRQVREGVRLDRDRAVEAIARVTVAIEGTKDKEEKKKLQADLQVLEENKARYEAQMKMVDEQIEGVTATEQTPGQTGLLEVVRSHVELKSMVKDYIKEL